MTKNNKNLLNSSLVLAFLSGLTIFSLKKWGFVEGVFGREASPFLVYAKASHYFMTPLFIFLMGTITHGHIKKYYDSGMEVNRRTGLTNIVCMVLLFTSGQSLLIIGSRDIKYYAELFHLIIGSFFVLMAFIHQRKN
jgi:hypothetical protein